MPSALEPRTVALLRTDLRPLLPKLAQHFLDDGHHHVAALEAAAASGVEADIIFHAHAMRGMSRHMGAGLVAELVGRIEADPNATDHLLSELRPEFEAACESIQALVAEVASDGD